VANLALSHQLHHGTHRLLNGGVLVDPVLVVEVDVVDLEAQEGSVAGLSDVLGVLPDRRPLPGVELYEAELGR
jgi:hypothetical protein